jgi:NAD(P)-dependent dehydrogenase (short-subunit alcohol dehydrogenase family)
MKTIVITGTSSGIGKATVKHFAANGWRVAATMRNPERETELNQIENVVLYSLDVTNEDSVGRATEQIVNDFGKIDVVVNNAGYDLLGAFEAASTEQIQRQFDVNVFGLMNVTRAFLPHFRANRDGMFVNISSLSGLVTLPFNSLYHASKWAVEGFSESLTYELESLGIQVKLIEPGPVTTQFYGTSLDVTKKDGLTDYNDKLATFNKNKSAAASGSMMPEQLGEAIYSAVTDGKPQLRYIVGETANKLVGMRKEKGEEFFFNAMKQFLS